MSWCPRGHCDHKACKRGTLHKQTPPIESLPFYVAPDRQPAMTQPSAVVQALWELQMRIWHKRPLCTYHLCVKLWASTIPNSNALTKDTDRGPRKDEGKRLFEEIGSRIWFLPFTKCHTKTGDGKESGKLIWLMDNENGLEVEKSFRM